MLFLFKSVFGFFGAFFRFWNGLKKQGKVECKYSNFYFKTISLPLHPQTNTYICLFMLSSTLRFPFVPIETDFIERITKR